MKRLLSALKTSVFAAALLVTGLSALPQPADALLPTFCSGDGYGCIVDVDGDLLMLRRIGAPP